MQYNSFSFILLFLPLFLAAYFAGSRFGKKSSHFVIILAGLIFYYFAGLGSLIILLAGMIVNYALSLMLERSGKGRKALLILAVAANAGLLLFYKFYDLAMLAVPAGQAGDAASAGVGRIIMPLGIIFFIFQQIMYVVGVYRGTIEKVDVLDYAAYILYFPKLIMGPMIEPVELISQINDPGLKRFNADNMAAGIKLFSFGLFKKLVIADTFMRGVDWGFSNIETATPADLILTMLFYTFEIYFDFSGYTDMATGISKMVNIELPVNFDSPYKADSIRDFWKRWHVSLTKFFTRYIYYPLGGNRKGSVRTYVNIMIVFLVSGLWHGANYTFILWGAIHGALQVLERLSGKYFDRIPKVIRRIYTFSAVNVLWLLFRSDSISQWHSILSRILSFDGVSVSTGMMNAFILPEIPPVLKMLGLRTIIGDIGLFSMTVFSLAALAICLIPENNYKTSGKRNAVNMILAAAAFVWGVICLGSESVFVYYNF